MTRELSHSRLNREIRVVLRIERQGKVSEGEPEWFPLLPEYCA